MTITKAMAHKAKAAWRGFARKFILVLRVGRCESSRRSHGAILVKFYHIINDLSRTALDISLNISCRVNILIAIVKI